MEKYHFHEEKWQKIYQILSTQKGIRVKNEASTLPFLEGMYFIRKSDL